MVKQNQNAEISAENEELSESYMLFPETTVEGFREIFLGLARVFEGISEQLGGLQIEVNKPIKGLESVKRQKKPAVEKKNAETTNANVTDKSGETEETDKTNESTLESADKTMDFPPSDTPPWEEITPKAEVQTAKATLSKDDLTSVIVAKIKQNRSNNEKVVKLLNSYGYTALSDLPQEKYEAFLSDISQL